MQKSETLEDFIRQYVSRQRSERAPENYASWLRSYGADSAQVFGEGMEAAAGQYARSLSGYGAQAEALGGAGLSGSGYSDYLQGQAYGTLVKARENLLRDREQTERKNRLEYATYRDKTEKERTDRLRRVITDLTDNAVLDYSAAYDYARTLGLSEEDATAGAAQGVAAAKEKVRKSLVQRIYNQQISSSDAVLLALSAGFSNEEAREIGSYAERLNEIYYGQDKLPKDYLAYLKQQLAKKK